MRRVLVAAWLLAACARPAQQHAVPSPPLAQAVPARLAPAPAEPTWPEPLAGALAVHGRPHSQPIALAPDARGDERWLAFVGSPEVAAGMWRVERRATGELTAEPAERWPAGVRVLGGTARGSVAYVLLESVGFLDQPAGMHGVWIDAWASRSPFDAVPMALANVADVAELEARVRSSPAPSSEPPQPDTAALLAALRGASTSGAALLRSLASAGLDTCVAWQSLFVQVAGHVDASTSADSEAVSHALAVVRSALSTQACGVDACEAWTERGRAVVRFAQEDGRWGLRAVIQDAPLPRPRPARTRQTIEASADPSATTSALASRARHVDRVLGEAPLSDTGGSIGVGLADLAPGVPMAVVREQSASRLYRLPVGGLQASAKDAAWEVAFADIDADGRTDVVLRMSGHRPDGSAVSWTQAFLAPPPSVQATSVEADLATALAMLDAPDAAAAARAAIAVPMRSVTRDEACRVLAAASTPSGFRRVSSPGARLLLFEEPGLPTWRPRAVSAAQVAADQASALPAHCAELTCSATRPYCSWTGGADSLHAWFDWRDGHLELAGAADYDGE